MSDQEHEIDEQGRNLTQQRIDEEGTTGQPVIDDPQFVADVPDDVEAEDRVSDAPQMPDR